LIDTSPILTSSPRAELTQKQAKMSVTTLRIIVAPIGKAQCGCSLGSAGSRPRGTDVIATPLRDTTERHFPPADKRDTTIRIGKQLPSAHHPPLRGNSRVCTDGAQRGLLGDVDLGKSVRACGSRVHLSLSAPWSRQLRSQSRHPRGLRALNYRALLPCASGERNSQPLSANRDVQWCKICCRKRLARSLLVPWKKSAVGALSRIWPDSIKTTRSATWRANAISCVTTMPVMPSRARS
jgi:hypothetical protein